MDSNFRRKVNPCEHDPRILIDSELKNEQYVDSFGFEWTEIDGFVGKESMSHGHIFGRFMLPQDFFQIKTLLTLDVVTGGLGD